VVLVLGPGGEPAIELLQPGRYPAAGGGLAIGGDLDQELARTVSKKRSILPRPSGRYGGE